MAAEFVQRGRVCVEQGQLQEAVRICRLGLLANPGAVEGRLVLGSALIALARFDEVLAEIPRVRSVFTVVGGNIQVEQNRLRQVTNRNVVDGDLQAFSNRGGFRIVGNRVDGNLQCKSNNPRPTGANNRVAGDKEDQCRGL